MQARHSCHKAKSIAEVKEFVLIRGNLTLAITWRQCYSKNKKPVGGGSGAW
jgi:hypothetical protein